MRLVFLLLATLIAAGCAHRAPAPATAPAPLGKNTVVWISIDGFRPDYLDRADTPFLHRVMREGAYTKQLVPVTPSLTFPSHVSEATGVTVDAHGIPGNAFYDEETKQAYSFPGDGSLLRAEPIWLAAPRQGVRTLVFGWPLSQHQTGAVRSDYFNDKFDPALTDDQRADALLNAWDANQGAKPLRLVMGYLEATDPAGHKFGPDAAEVTAKAADTDVILARLASRAVEIFNRRRGPGDQLYLLITTDHGMLPLHTVVNFDRLFDPAPSRAVRVTTSGPVAFVALDRLPEDQRAATRDAMLARLKTYDFLTAYTPQTLPPEWHDHATGRVGDILVMLKPGYGFSNALPLPTFPVGRVKGPIGMHGYPPADSTLMQGFAAVWRYPTPPGGPDLGPVNTLRLHPTVARWLGITPAPGATGSPLQIEQR